MRISPKFEWMRQYVELGLTYLPEDVILERLGAWAYGTSRGLNVHAAAFQNRNGSPYRIWMHTHYDSDKPYSKIDLLATLAHEMAHMVHWKHTTKHKKLEAKMLSSMMTLLNKEGYISEESELKERAATN